MHGRFVWRCGERKKVARCGFILITDTDPASSTKLVAEVKKEEARQKRANDQPEQYILNQMRDIKSRHKVIQTPKKKATKKGGVSAAKKSKKQGQ